VSYIANEVEMETGSGSAFLVPGTGWLASSLKW